MNKTNIMPFVWIFSIVVCNLLKIFLEIKIDLSIWNLMISKVNHALNLFYHVFNLRPGYIEFNFGLPKKNSIQVDCRISYVGLFEENISNSGNLWRKNWLCTL